MDPEAVSDGAYNICAAFESGKPFFIGRNGSSEMEALIFWNTYRHTSVKTRRTRPWNSHILRKLENGVGIWPTTEDSCDQWSKEYADSLENLNGVAAGWYEPLRVGEAGLLNTYAPDAFRMPLRSLEPCYVDPDLRWTCYLAGKRVAVVSSFQQTIEKQVSKKGIWNLQGTFLPPTTTWIPIRSYYPPAVSMGDSTGWPSHIQSWDDAASMIVQKIVDSEASIALIGCGGIGMIIGGRLKKLGISSIIMGGAVQVLFGIKGLRWETHPIISKFWNDAWVWPDPSETPRGAFKIEAGCYWAKPSTTPR